MLLFMGEVNTRADFIMLAMIREAEMFTKTICARQALGAEPVLASI